MLSFLEMFIIPISERLLPQSDDWVFLPAAGPVGWVEEWGGKYHCQRLKKALPFELPVG